MRKTSLKHRKASGREPGTGRPAAGRREAPRGPKTRPAPHRSGSVEWSTPPEFFEALDREFAFTLDVCATAENAKCVRFYTREQDGLSLPWRDACWFTEAKEAFMSACRKRGASGLWGGRGMSVRQTVGDLLHRHPKGGMADLDEHVQAPDIHAVAPDFRGAAPLGPDLAHLPHPVGLAKPLHPQGHWPPYDVVVNDVDLRVLDELVHGTTLDRTEAERKGYARSAGLQSVSRDHRPVSGRVQSALAACPGRRDVLQHPPLGRHPGDKRAVAGSRVRLWS